MNPAQHVPSSTEAPSHSHCGFCGLHALFIRYSLLAIRHSLFHLLMKPRAAPKPCMKSAWAHPRGGALLFVLILCGALAVCCFFFALMLHDTGASARLHVSTDVLQAGVDSATQHALALLCADVADGPADTFCDHWATVPHGRAFASRRAWQRYASIATNLSAQPWFELPGPLPGTVLRYRFSIVDCAVRGAAEPVAWHEGRWLPTDDLNAADIARLTELLRTFDAAATNAAWLARAVAQLADTRDDNHALHTPELPGTEAVRFEQVATGADQRWVHFDDTLRLGRYYEERASHNFFLIEQAELFFNRALGRSNIVVTLDREPLTYVAGWESYRDLRARAGLPRWHPDMWRGVIAATGAGLPEPAGTFKYQPVISNGVDTLYFDDDKLARYDALGQWRQTVTFSGWFSSLNELTRGDLRDVRERGALVTTAADAPDSIIMTNFQPNALYATRLISGGQLARACDAFFSIDAGASFMSTRFQEDGVAHLADGQPVRLDAAYPGVAELLVRSPRSGVNDRVPFYLESALLQQPEYIIVRNDSDAPVSIYGWRLGYRLGTRLFWSAPFTSSVVYHARTSSSLSNALPRIPARGQLIITPSAALYDWHYGALRNGVWGDNAHEDTPLIELGWQGWGPALRVRELRATREHRMPGSSNREFVWETDWQLRGDDISALRGLDELIGTPVVLSLPSRDAHSADVYGTIVAHDDDALTVRCAGSRARLATMRGAVLHLLTLPRAARELWLALPDGQPAAVWLPDQPTLTTGLVRNAVFSNTRERAATLSALGIATAHDWFVNAALYRPFEATACVTTATLNWSPGWARVLSAERGAWSFDTRVTRLPAGAPGLLYSEAHLSPDVSLPVRMIGDGTLVVHAPPSTPSVPMRDRIVLLSPSARAAGLHLFGEPGWIECAWSGLPQPPSPVRLTVAGRAAPPPSAPPRSLEEWQQQTNALPTLTVEAWDYERTAFVTCAVARTFDASDRLFAGLLTPAMFSNGTLRLRIQTHDRLAPDAAAIWLEGIYLHPLPAETVININTAPVQALLPFCGDDPTSVVRVVRGAPGAGYSSVSDALRTVPELTDSVAQRTAALGVRSDVFDVCIEIEVVQRTRYGDEHLARTTARRRIDRSPARANPLAPLRIQVL